MGVRSRDVEARLGVSLKSIPEACRRRVERGDLQVGPRPHPNPLPPGEGVGAVSPEGRLPPLERSEGEVKWGDHPSAPKRAPV